MAYAALTEFGASLQGIHPKLRQGEPARRLGDFLSVLTKHRLAAGRGQ
jgi:hypothetical protein